MQKIMFLFKLKVVLKVDAIPITIMFKFTFISANIAKQLPIYITSKTQ